MEKKKLYTIFMTVLLVGSLLSFTSLFGGQHDSNSPQTGNLPPNPAIAPPTAISFQATNIKASVETLFPTVLLAASTSEAEIGVIDSMVAGVGGIKRISNSFYRQQTGTSLAGPLVYVAELSIEEGALRSEIAQKLGGLDIFIDSQVLLIGLISLPSTVTFQNNELNLSQVHTFSNPASQAYLNLGTRKGDEITVSLEATLSGDSLQNLLAAEEKNITASPQIIFINNDFEILSLENSLTLNAQMNPVKTGLLEEIKGKITGVKGVSSADLTFSASKEPLLITFTEDAVLFKEDLETFFTDFNGVQNFEIDMNKRTAKIFFDQSLELEQFKEDLRLQLDALNFTVKEFTEPTIPLEGAIDFLGGDANEIVNQINVVLQEKEISNASFLQSAAIKADEITDEKKNETFTVENGSFKAMIKPGHAVGETVPLELLVIVTRGEISSISATEAKEKVIE